MKVGSGAEIKMFVSGPLQIKGCLGPVSAKKMTPTAEQKRMISAEDIGEGKTTEWFIGGLDPCLTLTFILDVQESKKRPNDVFIQFVTNYKHPSGKIFIRVTSIRK